MANQDTRTKSLKNRIEQFQRALREDGVGTIVDSEEENLNAQREPQGAQPRHNPESPNLSLEELLIKNVMAENETRMKNLMAKNEACMRDFELQSGKFQKSQPETPIEDLQHHGRGSEAEKKGKLETYLKK